MWLVTPARTLILGTVLAPVWLACSAAAPAATTPGPDAAAMADAKPDLKTSDTRAATDTAPDPPASSACRFGHLEQPSGPRGLTEMYRTPSDIGLLAGIAVSGGYVYFRDSGFGKVLRVPTAGGAAQPVGAGNGVVLFTAAGDKAAWLAPGASAGKHRLSLAPASAGGTPTALGEEIGEPRALAGDGSAAYVADGAAKTIVRFPLAGGAASVLVQNVTTTGMVVAGQHLYWTDFDQEDLRRVPVAGGAPESLSEIFFGGEMAADDANVYWADGSQGTVNKWPLAGGMASRLAASADPADHPDHIAAAGGVVYWTQGFVCGQIWEIGRDGTGKQVAAQGFAALGGIAVDAKWVYVVTSTSVYRIER